MVSTVVASALWINLDLPYLGFATASAFLFHVHSKPGWRQLLLAVVIAAVLGGLRLSVMGHPPDMSGFKAAMLGLGSFLVLGIRAAKSSGIERKRLFVLLGPALGLVLFIFAVQNALNLTGRLYPKTFDLYLYAFDGSFGFQPSFALGRLFHECAPIRVLGYLTYQTLPLAMALVYLGYIDPGATRPNWNLLRLFFGTGVLGWLFYNFVPAVGPVYAFPGAFPYVAPSQMQHVLERISVNPAFPRNAIPSLHMTWALLLWWNCRPFPRWARIGSLLYLLGTFVATMGIGEHYLVDLVAAVPFALTVEALCHSSIPLRTRRLPLFAGLCLTLMWLALVRLGAPLPLKSPLILWMLSTLSTAAVLFLEPRLTGPGRPASIPLHQT
ncbi:MAG: phosphatase PAP2 family protein [Candidatus Sulfotelmatobacter sp.]